MSKVLIAFLLGLSLLAPDGGLAAPAGAPVRSPNRTPTRAPARAPTRAPTRAPVRAPTRAPTRAPVRAPTRAPTRAPVRAPTRAPTRAPFRAPARAPTPASLARCPYNYTVQAEDTYCIISSKLGISSTRLLAANPSISMSNVSAGERFRIPCKPQTDCCPTYITSAAQGTGLGDILSARPDLSLDQLLAANSRNPNVSASYVPCGTEIKVPCRAGSLTCTGTGYGPTPPPRVAPARGPARAPPATLPRGSAPADSQTPPASNPTRAPISVSG